MLAGGVGSICRQSYRQKLGGAQEDGDLGGYGPGFSRPRSGEEFVQMYDVMDDAVHLLACVAVVSVQLREDRDSRDRKSVV